MNPYELQGLREAYAAQVKYSRRWMYPPNDHVIKWPQDVYAGHLWRDTVLFQETLSLPQTPSYESMRSRIFGNQLRQGRTSIKHLANLLNERANIYARHIADINDRHMRVQEQIGGEELRSPHEVTRTQATLEKLLVTLESDRRREEVDFWKDSRDIRELMFEKALDYQSTGNRARLLEAFGGTYDKA